MDTRVIKVTFESWVKSQLDPDDEESRCGPHSMNVVARDVDDAIAAVKRHELGREMKGGA